MKTIDLRRRAFTLLELTLSVSMLAVMMLVGYLMLQMAESSYRQVSGKEDAGLQMKKAMRFLEKDLVSASISQLKVVKGPSSFLSGGSDGSAVCMLNACQNGTDRVVLDVDGEPFWQRNILYYVAAPLTDHCQGSPDADGFDMGCPHKLLIRKIVDDGAATDPTSNIETLIDAASLNSYLTRPLTPTDVSNMAGEAGLKSVEIVAHDLVSVRIDTIISKTSLLDNEVEARVMAYGSNRNGREVSGAEPLSEKPGFLLSALSVFPRNR